jgi:prepilin-type N-terminal cleavage/methylation domain-containing protein
MNLVNQHDQSRSPRRGFTLVELMVSLAIVTILSSLTLAGLNVARQRVKADRTEITIRKIHEVIMPHYERFLTRTFPLVEYDVLNPPPSALGSLQTTADKIRTLVTKRRALVFEMPDGWADLLDTGATGLTPSYKLNPKSSPYTAIAQRLKTMAKPAYRSREYSDAECLWAMVIRGGFADPGIVEHFRESEFGDKDRNGSPEFIDGWGNPIRFLRWAPGFVSRYQPPKDEATSHDAFDPTGRDPLAIKTLFPLVFSCGPDGQPDIACRDAEGQFSYPKVAFDPYFATRSPTSSTTWHLMIVDSTGGARFKLGEYAPSAQYPKSFGTQVDPTRVSDDVHNHAMSR